MSKKSIHVWSTTGFLLVFWVLMVVDAVAGPHVLGVAMVLTYAASAVLGLSYEKEEK